jgi:hypothetical protein
MANPKGTHSKQAIARGAGRLAPGGDQMGVQAH